MSVLTLTRSRIRSGIYEGLLTTRAKIKADPVLELRLLESTLGTLELIPDPKLQKTWAARIEIPSSTISEAVQTFIISDIESGKTLDSFTMITGAPLQDDLRAEISLLRAELDMLKQAFRQHCVETSK